MLRRVHLLKLTIGSIALPAAEAHHLRDVLRLEAGATIELFDDAGQLANGVIKHVNPANVVVQVDAIEQGPGNDLLVTVAAAVPKGDRADWMVEKLTELGVARFIPLASERSVVLPAGKNKIERWERIAVESSKQCRRTGVMAIGALSELKAVIAGASRGIYFSTSAATASIQRAIGENLDTELTLLIGPEGGWTASEEQQMNQAGLVAASLTSTILRVETAAITAAALVICLQRGVKATHSATNTASAST